MPSRRHLEPRIRLGWYMSMVLNIFAFRTSAIAKKRFGDKDKKGFRCLPRNNAISKTWFTGSRFRLFVAGCCIAILGACATPPANDPEAIAEWQATNDPLEPFNRGIFEVNLALDRALIRPIAIGYRWVFPGFLRDAIENVLDNLSEPLNFANAVMQGNFDRASTAAGRLLVNSTLGIAGLIDVADTIGLKPIDEDFGQTLAIWGSGEIAYLVLPVLGPSSFRDGLGQGVDFFLNPLNYALDNAGLEWVGWTMTAVNGIDQRSRNIEVLDEIERSSVDFYAAIRSLYRQRRADLIKNGDPSGVDPFLGHSEDFPDDSELSYVN